MQAVYRYATTSTWSNSMITPDLESNSWRFPLVHLCSVLFMFFLPFAGIMHSLKFAINQRLELRRQLQERTEFENIKLSIFQESDD